VKSHFDSFFQANYRGMVGYCVTFGHRYADVEEEVSDVILKHYDEYREKITGPAPDATLRRWMNRRVLLNLHSKALRHENLKVGALPELFDQEHFDDPESLLDLKQRTPVLPAVLVEYEQYCDGRGAGGNTNTDRSKFFRAKSKFLDALNGEAEKKRRTEPAQEWQLPLGGQSIRSIGNGRSTFK
jgi:hypothetical protein